VSGGGVKDRRHGVSQTCDLWLQRERAWTIDFCLSGLALASLGNGLTTRGNSVVLIVGNVVLLPCMLMSMEGGWVAVDKEGSSYPWVTRVIEASTHVLLRSVCLSLSVLSSVSVSVSISVSVSVMYIYMIYI
jgi:hypothetical protein